MSLQWVHEVSVVDALRTVAKRASEGAAIHVADGGSATCLEDFVLDCLQPVYPMDPVFPDWRPLPTRQPGEVMHGADALVDCIRNGPRLVGLNEVVLVYLNAASLREAAPDDFETMISIFEQAAGDMRDSPEPVLLDVLLVDGPALA